MPITIFSPHSGNQVKVRDQDAGRAVKDEEGRIFYVLPKSDSAARLSSDRAPWPIGSLARLGSRPRRMIYECKRRLKR